GCVAGGFAGAVCGLWPAGAAGCPAACGCAATWASAGIEPSKVAANKRRHPSLNTVIYSGFLSTLRFLLTLARQRGFYSTAALLPSVTASGICSARLSRRNGVIAKIL